MSGPVGDSGRGKVWLLAARTGIRFGTAMTAGDVYVIARCPDRCQRNPGQAAFDRAGNLVVNLGYFTKSGIRDRLFVVAARNGTFYGRPMLAGHKYALAGAGPVGDSGDGEPALRADIAIGPVAIDHHGNVLLGERGTVRVVATSSGTFYGTAMTAGDIYTVGSDCCGSGPVGPWQLAIDAAGSIIMSEPLYPFDRVRVLAATSGTFYGVPMVAGHVYTIGGTAIPASPAALAVTASGDVLVGDALRVYSIAG